jgi:methylated-DNA-[protein]-cysteine S-methyltransferase
VDAPADDPVRRDPQLCDIARLIGSPTAFRAVGAATGKNPISIIAPCHRVIGSNGVLAGFAGGLATTERLLGIENGRAAR